MGKIFLGALLILTVTVYNLSQGVPETLATNPGATLYLHNSASSVLTGTAEEWKLDDAVDNDDSSSTVISVNNKLPAPLWFQYKPGVTNSSSEAGTSCSVNTPDNAGWILEDQFDVGGQITGGTWTFFYNETDNRDVNVGNMTVCVWRVTVSGGTINTSNLLFGASDTLDHWDGLVNNVSFTSSQSALSIGPNEYLYVEYFSSLTTINAGGPSANFTSTFRTGPGFSNPRIETPGIIIPEMAVVFLVAAPLVPYAVQMWVRKRQGLAGLRRV